MQLCYLISILLILFMTVAQWLAKILLHSRHSRVARILTGSNIRTQRADIFKDHCWMSLKHRIDINKCILMYKCLNNLAPCYLTDLFQTNNNIYQYRSSQSNNFHVDKSKLEYYNRSFIFTGAKLWNSLPQNVKDMPTLIFLKHPCKTYFLSLHQF